MPWWRGEREPEPVPAFEELKSQLYEIREYFERLPIDKNSPHRAHLNLFGEGFGGTNTSSDQFKRLIKISQLIAEKGLSAEERGTVLGASKAIALDYDKKRGSYWAEIISISTPIARIEAVLSGMETLKREIVDFCNGLLRVVNGKTMIERTTPASVSDAAIAGLAKKYGGILTKVIVSYETGEDLEKAEQALSRFIAYGEARQLSVGDMLIYDIPSARVHLSGIDKAVVELLLSHSGRMTRAELVKGIDLSIESLDASIKRLEIQGLVRQSPRGEMTLSAVS